MCAASAMCCAGRYSTRENEREVRAKYSLFWAARAIQSAACKQSRRGHTRDGVRTMVTDPRRLRAGDMGVALAMDMRCSVVRGSGMLPITSPPIRLWFLLIDCAFGRLDRPCMRIHRAEATRHLRVVVGHTALRPRPQRLCSGATVSLMHVSGTAPWSLSDTATHQEHHCCRYAYREHWAYFACMKRLIVCSCAAHNLQASFLDR